MKELSGAFNRGLRLGKLGLSLTGSYLGYQAQNILLSEEKRDQRRREFQTQSSRRVREELGTLKGAVMKLGQLLSMQTQALPDEAILELANLQMHAPAMHPTLARAQFKASLGADPEVLFEAFEEKPFAAASLGQVHRAVARSGERVAVKIQYPAIRGAIESDLKLLRSATFPARLVGHMPAGVVDEVRRGLLEETDYLNEARNIEFFKAKLKDFDYLTIPNVYRDLTTERVLTMSFVEGEILGFFLKKKPSQAVRNLIGTRLIELYYVQLHRMRALHADHHPGNYLLQPDGRIGLVDFGCVKHINFDATDLIRSCVGRTWRKGDKPAAHVCRLIFGASVPFARAKRMLPILEVMTGILYPEGKQANPVVDFGRPEPVQTLIKAMKKAVQDKLSNPEFAFLTRAEWGLYSLLHQLNAKVNVRETWRRCDN